MLTPIQLALSKIALHSGEFISLTSKLEFVETDKVPTAGTDGRRVYYNREFVASLNLRQTIGLILHEVGHNMYAHMARLGQRNQEVANIAMDIVLNRNLQDYFNETRNTLNAEFPPSDLVPGPQWAKYDGWNWEKVYADLMEKSAGKRPGKQFDFVMPGVDENGRKLSPEEQENLAKEWTMAAAQAATMAKQRGLHSGFFESFVSGMTKTPVDWKAQVYDHFTRTARDDSSWRRFNRKMIYADTYLPTLFSERIGRVGFMVDTSGSMEDDNFKIAIGGMNEILETLRPETIIFGCCDTKMQSVEEITPDDLPVVAKQFKGRGGTFLTPIFEYIRELEEPLELVVVLTDGQCDTIDQALEPECPVLWLVTTDSFDAINASFGKIIQVEG